MIFSLACPLTTCSRNAYPIDSNVYDDAFYRIYDLGLTEVGTGSSDNYAYLVVDDKSKDAVIIDPANPDECVQQHHILPYSGGTDAMVGLHLF